MITVGPTKGTGHHLGWSIEDRPTQREPTRQEVVDQHPRGETHPVGEFSKSRIFTRRAIGVVWPEFQN